MRQLRATYVYRFVSAGRYIIECGMTPCVGPPAYYTVVDNEYEFVTSRFESHRLLIETVAYSDDAVVDYKRFAIYVQQILIGKYGINAIDRHLEKAFVE